MAFNVSLYNFSKRENSTKRPDTDPVSFQCILKEGSSIITPTISLDLGLGADPSAYNYAYIPEYGRYYYIQNWYFDNALWTASMIVDVLATFKNEIGYTSLYVLRSSAAYDGSIIDGLYPAKITHTHYLQTQNLYTSDITAGAFVIGVVSKDANFGSLAYYALSYAAMVQLTSYLLDDAIIETNGFSVDDASLELQKSLIDPLSYIKSCVYIPMPYMIIQGAAARATVWSWNTGVACKRIGNNVIAAAAALSFPLHKHPQAGARGLFCNVSPYADIRLLSDPFGEIALDTMVLANQSSVTIDLRMDVTNGIGYYTIESGGYILSRINTQVGVPVNLSQVVRDYLGAASAAVQGTVGTVSAALAGDVAGAIGAAGAGIVNSVKAIQPRQTTLGGSGSFAAYDHQISLQEIFYQIVDDDNDHHGRPLCQMRTPASLGGYMIVQDGDVPTAGTQSETAEIKSYLESGFFYE